MDSPSSSQQEITIDTNRTAERSIEEATETPRHKKAELKLNSFFKFWCPNVSGIERRNVPKFVVREYLKYLTDKKEVIFNELSKSIELSKDNYENILNMHDNIRISEKNRDKGKYKKDYIRVINSTVEYYPTLLIFNMALKDTLKKFEEGNFGRIQISNREIYFKSLKNVHNGTCQCIIKAQEKLKAQEDKSSSS